MDNSNILIIVLENPIFFIPLLFISGLMGALFNFMLNFMKYSSIPMARKKLLEGHWSGNGIQDNGPGDIENIPITADVNFIIKTRKIVGHIIYNINYNNQKYSFHLEFEGRLFNNTYMLVNYKNRKNGIIQFGTGIFDLDPVGDKIEGKFCGFAPMTNGIVSGRYTLTKI